MFWRLKVFRKWPYQPQITKSDPSRLYSTSDEAFKFHFMLFLVCFHPSVINPWMQPKSAQHPRYTDTFIASKTTASVQAAPDSSSWGWVMSGQHCITSRGGWNARDSPDHVLSIPVTVSIRPCVPQAQVLLHGLRESALTFEDKAFSYISVIKTKGK